jgi:hypothetical protein
MPLIPLRTGLGCNKLQVKLLTSSQDQQHSPGKWAFWKPLTLLT